MCSASIITNAQLPDIILDICTKTTITVHRIPRKPIKSWMFVIQTDYRPTHNSSHARDHMLDWDKGGKVLLPPGGVTSTSQGLARAPLIGLG